MTRKLDFETSLILKFYNKFNHDLCKYSTPFHSGATQRRLKNDEANSTMMQTKDIKKQRALVLQGGGALGAYEAGVIRTLYEKLSEKDKQKWRE